jgi:hypothetical protein
MPNKAEQARAEVNEGMEKDGDTNRSQLGDPVSLKAGSSKTEVGKDNCGTVGVGEKKERTKRDSKM